mgnify:CR=1 FL=1
MIAPAEFRILDDLPRPTAEEEFDALDLIERDHAQQLKVCALLLEAGPNIVDEPDGHLVAAIIRFLKQTLPHHLNDEERGLFPLLEERCGQESDVRAIIRQLQSEHEFDEDLVDFLLSDLEVLAQGRRLANPQRLNLNLHAFAQGLQRHIQWENAVVMPLARRVLQAEDLERLGREMVISRWSGPAA